MVVNRILMLIIDYWKLVYRIHAAFSPLCYARKCVFNDREFWMDKTDEHDTVAYICKCSGKCTLLMHLLISIEEFLPRFQFCKNSSVHVNAQIGQLTAQKMPL